MGGTLLCLPHLLNLLDMDQIEKIKQMLDSTDLEMIQLGISLLITTLKPYQVRQIIPWNTMPHGSHIGYNQDGLYGPVGKRYTREPYRLNPTVLLQYPLPDTIWIRKGIAITIVGASLICRTVGLMSCLHDFEKRTKIIYDE